MLARRVAGILLAAGRSERFGADKLLATLPQPTGDIAKGTPIAVAAGRKLIAVLPHSLAVVRPGAALLATRLRKIGLRVVPCPIADQGMSASLAFGVAGAADADAWVIALGDMPWVDTSTIRAVADALASGAPLVVPTSAGVRGHPVGFSARFGDELTRLTGDRGARSVLAAHAAEVVEVEVDDAGIARDVDTREDLARAAPRGA